MVGKSPCFRLLKKTDVAWNETETSFTLPSPFCIHSQISHYVASDVSTIFLAVGPDG
jgi:hypothetical protein